MFQRCCHHCGFESACCLLPRNWLQKDAVLTKNAEASDIQEPSLSRRNSLRFSKHAAGLIDIQIKKTRSSDKNSVSMLILDVQRKKDPCNLQVTTLITDHRELVVSGCRMTPFCLIDLNVLPLGRVGLQTRQWAVDVESLGMLDRGNLVPNGE